MDYPTEQRKPIALKRASSKKQPDVHLLRDAFARQMQQDVLQGLGSNGQKQLPSMYFYDEAGSRFYEQITRSSDYYPTRHEAALLRQIQNELPIWVQPSEMVELGSGSSTKTPLVLDAFTEAGYLKQYTAIDIDPSVLEISLLELRQRYGWLNLVGLAGRFEETLASLMPGDERLFLFLGGTLGNFTPAYQRFFFQNMLEVMTSGDSLLVGFDIRTHGGKPISIIEQAYNDAEGITAQFNLNMLRHINTVLGTSFNLDLWTHDAFYNTERHQIEMHLKSRVAQSVSLDDRTFDFEAGETILTELSRKFHPDELADWFEALGFEKLTIWTDAKQFVGLILLQKP